MVSEEPQCCPFLARVHLAEEGEAVSTSFLQQSWSWCRQCLCLQSVGRQCAGRGPGPSFHCLDPEVPLQRVATWGSAGPTAMLSVSPSRPTFERLKSSPTTLWF